MSKTDLIIRKYPILRINQNNPDLKDHIELRNDHLRLYYEKEKSILEAENIEDQAVETYTRLFNNLSSRQRKLSNFEERYNLELNKNYFDLSKSKINNLKKIQNKDLDRKETNKEADHECMNEKIITRISKDFQNLQQESIEEIDRQHNNEIDIILEKQFFYDHSLLIFSCEFLILNESNLDFDFTFQENNFIYDKIHFSATKFENKAQSIQIYDEEFISKNFLSLKDSKQLNSKWKYLLNENKNNLNLFTGNFNNKFKNMIFSEIENKHAALNFFKLTKHPVNNIQIKQAEEVPSNSTEYEKD